MDNEHPPHDDSYSLPMPEDSMSEEEAMPLDLRELDDFLEIFMKDDEHFRYMMQNSKQIGNFIELLTHE